MALGLVSVSASVSVSVSVSVSGLELRSGTASLWVLVSALLVVVFLN
jgi:hypothetical protein